jgi:hypothetical protein
MDLVHLNMIAGYHAHARTYSGAIAFGPNELDFDPILLIAAIVASK